MSVNWNNLDNGLKELTWDFNSVAGWCCWNKLLIHPEKTKFIIFGTRQLLKNLPDDLSIQFLGEILIPSKSVKDLGVTLDRELTFDEHINNVVKCCNYSLCQISRVRHLFNKEHIEAILNSLVFSKLYFSSTLWSNTTKRNVGKLQQVQNFAARIVDNKKKFEHITPTLKALKWLPVSDKLVLIGTK
jgi:hypothetical protein